jgi:hypothetical protein
MDLRCWARPTVQHIVDRKIVTFPVAPTYDSRTRTYPEPNLFPYKHCLEGDKYLRARKVDS